jgi:hypothetical protein
VTHIIGNQEEAAAASVRSLTIDRRLGGPLAPDLRAGLEAERHELAMALKSWRESRRNDGLPIASWSLDRESTRPVLDGRPLDASAQRVVDLAFNHRK